ncbi:MAG: hypothetical protein QM731_06940 [Chitinophagaceae bacterium]
MSLFLCPCTSNCILLPQTNRKKDFQTAWGIQKLIYQTGLLIRLSKNDESAFRELYAYYWKKLYNATFKHLLPPKEKFENKEEDLKAALA